MIEDTPAQYRTRMQQHAEESLGAVAAAAQAAGVVCQTVQVEDEHPYQAIIDIAGLKGCDLIVMAVARPSRHLCDCARQRDGKGPHALQDPGAGPSMSLRGFNGDAFSQEPRHHRYRKWQFRVRSS